MGEHQPAAEKTILAQFVPEAWINDDAVEVDAEGPTTWDVTAYILSLPRAEALAIRDNRDESDALRDLPNAPKWVRSWRGPFMVMVDMAIEAYFRCDRCRARTDANDLCQDETCPFHDHVQSCTAGWSGHPDRDPNPEDDTSVIPCTCPLEAKLAIEGREARATTGA